MQAGDNSRCGNTLAAGQVVEEKLEIAIEIANVGWSDERENCGIAVWSLEKIPFGAQDGWGGDGDSISGRVVGR